jgi:hypothetical protein
MAPRSPFLEHNDSRILRMHAVKKYFMRWFSRHPRV